jgi:hypothetical protein
MNASKVRHKFRRTLLGGAMRATEDPNSPGVPLVLNCKACHLKLSTRAMRTGVQANQG